MINDKITLYKFKQGRPQLRIVRERRVKALSRGKRTCGPPVVSRWPPPLMGTRNSDSLPVSWIKINIKQKQDWADGEGRRLMEESRRVIKGRERHHNSHSLDGMPQH
ncbi:hypothetical protein EVAR_33529_1 [Eumeta japonica]|uniref:Uncharacterized protein n=1 Tax=Eumeta variegata TaxID=151549 RepID=A0A4C1VJT1_EUMVA|nr:hypothetical protein EVAR_33529_1 [Eumeta japonica]